MSLLQYVSVFLVICFGIYADVIVLVYCRLTALGASPVFNFKSLARTLGIEHVVLFHVIKWPSYGNYSACMFMFAYCS